MAIDEAMLGWAAGEHRDPTAPTCWLRLYLWDSPTLSLGYFQSFDDPWAADWRRRGLPLVRRCTGGGALCHDHEITYAIALPASHPAGRRPSTLYDRVHDALATVLRDHGLACRRRGEPSPGSGSNTAGSLNATKPFLCFHDRDPHDLVWEQLDVKVVGSAQRRRRGGLLQHGGLLLKRSDHAPDLLGVEDLGLAAHSPDFWTEQILQVVERELGLEPEPHELDDDEIAEVERLVSERYGNPAWTARR